MTSVKMKGHFLAAFKVLAVMSIVVLSSCQKDENFPAVAKGPQPSKFSSEVLDKWMTLQLRLMKNATGIPNQAFSRHYAYSGITALQSMAPGFHGKPSWINKWNGLTGLPVSQPNDHFYYPANVNAALAQINRLFFPNANASDKNAIDSLENALKAEYLLIKDQPTIDLSADYGKAVAVAVFNWAETDGYKDAGKPYTPPVGDGLWVPTPPALAPASTPYWGKNRPIVAGSTNNTRPAAPESYSVVPGSPFYQMAKHVYDVSQTLTDDQKAMAMFWRDVPGVTSPGHWLSILQQTIRKTEANLEKGALAYALTGTAINDALISTWDSKFHYNLVRPITYIRNVLGHTTWNSFIGTPPHPEYSSAHSALSAAAAEMMEQLFGNIGIITDNTYNYMGMSTRSYSSFTAIAVEAAQSRVYAGIHYQPSVEAGLVQGKKVTENILSGRSPY